MFLPTFFSLYSYCHRPPSRIFCSLLFAHEQGIAYVLNAGDTLDERPFVSAAFALPNLFQYFLIKIVLRRLYREFNGFWLALMSI